MSVSYVVELIDKRDFDDLIKKRDRQFAAAEMTRQQFMMQGVLDRAYRQALSSTLGVIN